MKRLPILALMLALVLLAAACGGAANTPTNATTAAAAATTAAAAETTAADATTAAEATTAAAATTTAAAATTAEVAATTPAAAAAGDNPWAGFDTSKEIHLVFYNVGSKGTDHDRVVGIASDRMKELINTTIEVPIIPLSDFQTKYPLVLAGGEDVDIIMTHPYIGPFSTHADNGAFYELTDEFLAQWMPETMKSQIPNSWGQAMYKGKLYQIPRNQSDYENTYGVTVLKHLREKYNIPEISDIEGVEAYLFAVAEGEQGTGMFAMYVQPTVPLSLTFLMGINNFMSVGAAMWDADNPGTLNPDDLFMSAESPEYREYVLRMARWAQAGVWPSNAITNVTHLSDLFSEGKSASDIGHYKSGNSDILDMEAKGIVAEYFNILPSTASTRISAYNNDALAITSFCKNPERAALAIDVMKNDYEVNNMLQGGIEGEHYIHNLADDTHERGPNSEAYPWSGWAWCLRSQLNPGEGGIKPEVMAVRDQYDKANIDPVRFPVDGFNVDNSGFEAESALINSLNQEWASSFDLGIFGDNTEDKLQEYIGLLKEAGMDKILSETKSQLAEFMAAN